MDTNEDVADVDAIIEALDQGEFNIEHCEDCNCSFDWGIDKNGDLFDDVDTDACWDGNVLVANANGCAYQVAEFIRYGSLKIFIDGITADDIPGDILSKMRISDMRERGETGNPECHDKKRKAALVAYLMECGYELDMDDNRGFANEYTMILRDTGEPTQTTIDEAEEWAESYLYRGDAATESFVNFRFDQRE